MTITRCDRCGKQIKGIDIKRLTVEFGCDLSLAVATNINADLCTNCTADLRRWLYESGTEDQEKS